MSWAAMLRYLDTVIGFRLRFGLFWWRIQYSQRARGTARHKRIRDGAYHFKELVVKAVCSEAAKRVFLSCPQFNDSIRLHQDPWPQLPRRWTKGNSVDVVPVSDYP